MKSINSHFIFNKTEYVSKVNKNITKNFFPKIEKHRNDNLKLLQTKVLKNEFYLYF